MNRELINVIEQIGREKGIDKEILFEALESALLSASRKTLGPAENIRMHIDRKSGDIRVYGRKKVVQEVTDDKLEISLEAAKALNRDAELDDELELEQERPPQEFGRIAAQTAKQVILEIGKAEAILPEREQIPGERYNPGDRIRAFVLEVRRTAKGPQIALSRTHPGYLARLFETEIPEIQEGIVIVKAAAREGGERAKVAVASTKRDVDPIGACVGLRGTRIQVISRELRGEKINIVEWSADPATFVGRALSPAKVASVTVGDLEEEGDHRSVIVVVPDNQLSLAIGKRGQNARLAAKLTGLRVDIKSESEVEEERRLAEEELARGREALAEFPGVGPQLIERLVEHGLFSPARIVHAGIEALEAVPGLGEKKGAAILVAAQEWIEQHPRVEQ